jgi:hypothetical protein
MLGLAAFLSSSTDQHRVDFQATPPDGVERIEQLWFVTYIDRDGREIVAQAKLTSGQYAPLIAADAERLESIVEAARFLAKANNVNMRLVKFTNRSDVEEITP